MEDASGLKINEAAVESFDRFPDEFAQCDLRPNVLSGKSNSVAGLGQKQQSLVTMRQIPEENPNHPLNSDAKLVIAEME